MNHTRQRRWLRDAHAKSIRRFCVSLELVITASEWLSESVERAEGGVESCHRASAHTPHSPGATIRPLADALRVDQSELDCPNCCRLCSLTCSCISQPFQFCCNFLSASIELFSILQLSSLPCSARDRFVKH